jgi:hypothetical protein
MAHREIPVKVTAWVDEGIAPLVTALSDVPGVLTLDSCQEGQDGLARVTFCTHDNQALPRIVERMTHFLERWGWQERATVQLWAGCDGDTLSADLYCPPALVSALAGEIRLSADRMNPSHDDTACTTPGSWTASLCRPPTLPSGGGTPRRDG